MSNQNFPKFLNKGISTPVGILIIVLVAVIAGGVLTWQYLEIPKEETETSEIIEPSFEPRIIKVSFDPDNPDSKFFSSQSVSYTDANKLIFTDIKGELIKIIDAEEMLKKLMIPHLLEPEGPIPIAIVFHEAIEDEEAFYFFATNMDFCGATGNCGWYVYKLDKENQQFYRFKDDIFGSLGEYRIAPDGKKIAVFHNFVAGICIQSQSITVIDLNKFDEFQKVKGFEDKEYSVNNIKLFEWVDNETLKFSVIQYQCKYNEQSKEKWHREFKYHLSSQEIELIKEELQISE